MPSNDEHCRRTKKRYGVRGEDIHRWMDEPVKLYGSKHRKSRHTTDYIPLMFIEKYGRDLTTLIMEDHILADREETRKRVVIKRTPRVRTYYQDPTSYCEKCGGKLVHEANFCIDCGVEIPYKPIREDKYEDRLCSLSIDPLERVRLEDKQRGLVLAVAGTILLLILMSLRA